MIAIGVVLLILIAALYYEAPKLIGPHTSASSTYDSALDYPGEYGNADNWALSANTGIPASNASVLSEKAFNGFPMQTTPFLQGGSGRQVALGGISYIANAGNYELYGMNIETQTEIFDTPLPNAPNESLPSVAPLFHTATTGQIGGSPLVWVSTPWDGVYSFTTIQGIVDHQFNLTVPAVGSDGNRGAYSVAAPEFGIDQSRSIIITGLSVNTTGTPGRGFVEGWKISGKTASSIWTTYLSPPQDGSNPQWEAAQVNSTPHLWEFDGTTAVDLKALPASTLQSIISGDWSSQSGNAIFSTGPEANSTWLVDAANDTTYISTSSPLPVSYSNSFNGPGLFSSSVVALNTTSGSILWSFQVTPHDVWGWGCKGNIAMLQATIGGTQRQVIAKACENGYLFLLNPSSGALLYSGQVPGVVRANGAHLLNVQNQSAMHASLASLTGGRPTQNPAVAYGTNIAYDQDNGLLLGAVGKWGNPLGGLPSNSTGQGAPWNSTVWAFDLVKQTFAWQSQVPNQEFSYIGTSNGVAYLGTYQGEIYVGASKTGSALEDIHVALGVSSLLVTNGVHGQPGLVVVGFSVNTKQQVQMELFTPGGR
ncbi:MAG: hypothetical protein OK455_06480 [Thaumarchaeota archaeon]|nr:hypothetical protein [Nitrososphaerota archaeon]